MSAMTENILRRIRVMIPPMLSKLHKGQLGRVAVIGGSDDYAGAPFFSAVASARLGCDMSHIICTPSAAAVIKTYSPNLIVHPLMRQTPAPGAPPNEGADEISAVIVDQLLPRLHVLVVGPGLGRDPLMLDTAAAVIRAARARGMPVVLDAEALLLVAREPDMVRGYAAAVLTPNLQEFSRLCRDMGVDGVGADARDPARVEALARALGGVTVVQKGVTDYVANGSDPTLVVDVPGGRKRSAGQGDTLTGSLATFLAWRKAYMDRIWEVDGARLGDLETVGLATYGGCAITRESSRLAFEKRGRSLQASDLTDEVHSAFLNLFGEVDEVESGTA